MEKTSTKRRGKYFTVVFLIIFLPLVFYIFSLKTPFNKAPWAIIADPYFEVGMGYVYKKTTIEEAKKLTNFKIFQPIYYPSSMPNYQVAIAHKPTANSEVAFFTPKFPGIEPGSLSGLLIKESLTEDKDLLKNATKLFIDDKEVFIFSLSPQIGIGFYIKKSGTNIVGFWFDDDINQSELMKIAESILKQNAN